MILDNSVVKRVNWASDDIPLRCMEVLRALSGNMKTTNHILI